MQQIGMALHGAVKRLEELGPMPNDAICHDCEKPLESAAELAVQRAGVGKGEIRFCDCVSERERKERRFYAITGLPNRDDPRTFGNFQPRPGTEDAVAAARALVDGLFLCLTLAGDTGNGKSHLAEAVTREMLAQRKTARYEFCEDLLDRIRASFSDHSEQRAEVILAACYAPHLLVLDELALRLDDKQEFAATKLGEVVDTRLRDGKPMVITTNKTYAELRASPYFRIASRIFDKGTGKVRAVAVNASDYRITGDDRR